MPVKRNQILYFFLIIATIGLGLISRVDFIPKLIYPYLGDILYSLMVFLLIGLLFPNFSSLKVVCVSVLICFFIEFSQFYEADWIMEIRKTKLGGLILGYGFLWSDLISYVIGGVLGFSLEYFMLKKTRGIRER